MIIEINKIKPYKGFHFAWDNVKENIEDKLKLITKIIKPYKLMCYVLIGFNSLKSEDLYRIEILRKYKIMPFVMPYNKKDKYQKNLARYTNIKSIFTKLKWADYKY